MKKSVNELHKFFAIPLNVIYERCKILNIEPTTNAVTGNKKYLFTQTDVGRILLYDKTYTIPKTEVKQVEIEVVYEIYESKMNKE